MIAPNISRVILMDIERLLNASEGKEKIMGDVLRTLYLFSGTLWLPELYNEYVGFVRTLGEEPVDFEDVKEAVEVLREVNLVTATEGIRGTSKPEGERTLLISLSKDLELRSRLGRDRRVLAYLGEWKKYFPK